MSYRDCIDAIARAAGRTLSDAEIGAIYERVHKAALDIKAGRTPPSAQMPLPGMFDSLIGAAARLAADDLMAEAAVRLRNSHLQLARLAARRADAGRLQADGQAPLEAVRNLIARDYSGRTATASLEQAVMGYESYFLRKVIPAWESLGRDFVGFFTDRTKSLELIREIKGESTGNALAARGARAWLDTTEEARRVFNSNGGRIGRLDDWGLPQHHSQMRVAAAGRDVWVDQVLPLLDRARYANELDGVPWTDAELREFLGHAWDTIATDGYSKVTPGQPRGFSSRSSRHAEHRQIHFRDADSLVTYWDTFGERTMVEIMQGHVRTMARDIAFLEHFGPDPNVTYQTLRDEAGRQQALGLAGSASASERRAAGKVEAETNSLDTLYDYAAGRTKPPVIPTLRSVSDGVAHANVFGKLGSAAITSFFGDKPMLEAVSHLNNLPLYRRWSNEVRMLSPTQAADRRLLERQGLMLDSVRSGLQRFGDDLGQGSTLGRLANATMRLTGMQAVNDLRKGAFAATLMDAIGHELQRGVSFGELAQSDIRTLRVYGITEADWNVWRLATPDTLGGNHTLLTPDAIARIPDQVLQAAGLSASPADAARLRRAATVKLLGAINTESEFAVVTPGWRERAQMFGNIRRGTVPGEIWRSVLQFKSFPFTYLKRSLDAVANKDTPASKAAMTAWLVVGTTIAGAMIMQTKEILAGKDPRAMADENWMKFWGSAFIYGGALGFYGDFLYSANQTRYGSGPVEALAGPTVGPLLELALVQPMGAIRKRMEGKDTNLASQTINDLKGFVPFNNAWYAKAAIDHLIWQQVNEALNPGYLSKLRRRTRREYGQNWWWEPGTTAPQRAPDLAAAVE